MAKEISCDELGIVGCDFIARGETAGDVVEQVVQHLHSEHDIDLPDADAILEGRVGDNPNVVGSSVQYRAPRGTCSHRNRIVSVAVAGRGGG
jgi:predicted small metal-binding protein